MTELQVFEEYEKKRFGVIRTMFRIDEEDTYTTASSSTYTSVGTEIEQNARDILFMAALGTPLFAAETEQTGAGVPSIASVAQLGVTKMAKARKKTIAGPYKAAMVRKVLRLAKAAAAVAPKDKKGFFEWLNAP